MVRGWCVVVRSSSKPKTMASGRLLAAIPIPRRIHITAASTLAKAIPIQKHRPLSTEASPTRGKVEHNVTTTSEKCERILILGGGIAGLSTARYLLDHAQQQNTSVKITLIDENVDFLPTIDTLPSLHPSSKEERLHKNIPSRRNGNVLCPSLTVPWTSRSLWNEAILPKIKSIVRSNEPSPSVTFDWPSLMNDKDMWSFGAHFLLQKFILGRPEHQSNRSILEYSMKCLDDPSDELVQSIDYGRCATGTQLVDGTIIEGDSSGDIGLFCAGLLNRLMNIDDGDKLTMIPGEEATMLHVNAGAVQGVTTIDQYGDQRTREADKIVVALGVKSSSLCKGISVPCPVFPVKGHLATVASKTDYKYNLTLDGGVGYAVPMAHVDSEGRRHYRLSGFVDFTPKKEVDYHRVDALLDATRKYLPDAELVDASACHRPISADDRPLIGPTAKFPNLFLCTGFGSRGWTIGLGSGKLLASQILGIPCDIDPTPYSASRFRWSLM